MPRILSRDEVIHKIMECLEELDNVTLEDIFNQVCTEGKGRFPISYDQGDMFVKERSKQ